MERAAGSGVDWWTTVLEQWVTARTLPEPVAAAVRDMAPMFVETMRWESANGYSLTPDAQLLIAAQACLLVVERGLDAYARVGSVLVHGATLVSDGEHRIGAGGLVSDGRVHLDGQTEFRGALSLSWPAVLWDARHPRTGRNVVLHEFAHHLDMDDGVLDGTPAGLDPALRPRWARVMGAEYAALRRGPDDAELRDYAATDPGEFFAVAVETFVTRPVPLRHRHPAVYELLRRHFALDPATWP